ncbi:MAG: ABC transporter substrate-binding protein [Prolixibacteraceae bacterium]|nr:ABC transporter substrate-binding protein [Prolixibacteraceae bacterium]
MKIRKIINGFLALLFTAAILLVSDLENRKDKSETNSKRMVASGMRAIPGRNYKIGLTYFAPEKAFDRAEQGIWDGLKDLGFVKDSNITCISQHANGEMANLQPIHLNMDNQDIDLIVVTSTPAVTAALSVVKNHPIVFSLSYTPLEAGAGKSFTDHRPNITGVGSFPPVEKTIDFIVESIPNVKRIGTLYNSSEANSVKVIGDGRKYCESIGIELVENTAINTNEVYQAISALCMRNVDAIWITGDNTAFQAFSGIVKVCHENKVPLVINDIDFVDDGALAAVGISWYKTGYRTASYVARVLNGESPADIPIENYVDEIIRLNTDYAKELGIQFPDKYLHHNKLKGNNYKFCLAHYVDSPNSENAEHGLRDELKRIGLIEGEDFTLKVFNAQGDISTLNSIAEAISSDRWDIVFTTSTPTIQSISKKITDTPIVFTNVGDPLIAGLGDSFDNHMNHLTGISTLSDFEGMVKLVKEAIPGIKTIGTIYTPGEVNSVSYNDHLKIEAEKYGLKLISVPANSATEVADAALSIANQGIEAFTQISDNLTASCGASIIKTAYNSKIPYFAFISKQTDQGAIASIARDYYFAGVDAVNMAKEILEGTSPANIPFRYVTKSSLKVNTEAMEYFNIQLPEKYTQKE